MSEPKKLYKEPQNKMLFGVCAGIATYFNADVSIIRIVTVLIGIFTGGTVVLAYLIGAIILPDRPGS